MISELTESSGQSPLLSLIPQVEKLFGPDVANVSGQVVSHTSGQLDRQGTKIIPSTLLPSDHRRPGGTNPEGGPQQLRGRDG